MKPMELAAVEKPDLATMDIRLAGARDGIDAAKELNTSSASDQSLRYTDPARFPLIIELALRAGAMELPV